MRAALQGRVLILDGIEKAERNVLPVLNNLLENREMQLDDGRLIVAHERYDTLKQVSNYIYSCVLLKVTLKLYSRPVEIHIASGSYVLQCQLEV